VNSPVTQTPCHFYKVDIERFQRDSRGGGSWRHYKTDAGGVPFYLADATGKVLVNAHGAEYDLMQTCKRETGSLRGGFRLFGSAKDSALPAGGSWVDDGALVSYAESLATGSGASPLGLSSALGGLALSSGFSFGGSGRYRFTECCILPGHWYDLTGTCTENQSATGEHDRNLICKGENEPTFLISWRSEKNLESRLRNRALLHIFGGGALAVACLALLLLKFGWL